MTFVFAVDQMSTKFIVAKATLTLPTTLAHSVQHVTVAYLQFDHPPHVFAIFVQPRASWKDRRDVMPHNSAGRGALCRAGCRTPVLAGVMSIMPDLDPPTSCARTVLHPSVGPSVRPSTSSWRTRNNYVHADRR